MKVKMRNGVVAVHTILALGICLICLNGCTGYDELDYNEANTTTTEQSSANHEENNATISAILLPSTEYANRNGIELIDFSARNGLVRWINNLPEEPEQVLLRNKSIVGVPEYKLDLDGEYIYIGDMKDNAPDGYGILLKYDADLLTRSMQDSLAFAQTQEEQNAVWDPVMIVYIGEFKSGKYHGYGMHFNVPDKEIADAIMNNGYTYIEDEPYKEYMNVFFNYLDYEGNFSRGEFDGKGNVIQSNALEVAFENMKNGKGFYIDPRSVDFNFVIGKFSDGGDSGKVKVYYLGNLLYDGEEHKGQYHGKGTEYYPGTTNIKYDGEYKKGQFHGEGILYDEQGNVSYHGEWKNGNPQ